MTYEAELLRETWPLARVPVSKARTDEPGPKEEQLELDLERERREKWLH